MPVYNVKTFEAKKPNVARNAWWRDRHKVGCLALALAAVALYGLVSFGAVSRTREMGIRVSLGANASNVVWLIVRSAIGMVVVGCVAGVALGLGLSRFVESQLYGIRATDVAAIGTAVGILLFTALVAALVPGLRAARVDATTALRYESRSPTRRLVAHGGRDHRSGGRGVAENGNAEIMSG